MYVVTKPGRQAWESQDRAVPEQYRRMLWLIDVQGEKRALQSLLQEIPERLLRDWMRELEELRLIEARPAGPDDETIPLALNRPALEAGARVATALESSGAYIALRERKPVRKSPAETAVLIVEDDPDQLALADLRVSLAGFCPRVAASVAELVRSLHQDGPPDLLLLDVMLPDGNGFHVLGKMRRHPVFGALPIIMLTAERGPGPIGRGLALGADGYVTKPYSKDLLVRVIRGVLGE
ncbi:MAG TPA: response regulator [Burkholderiales bacterium]|jgi:two-component system, OmpR family, response regulator|nr:response regulator [Burkholderiales bacterium]